MNTAIANDIARVLNDANNAALASFAKDNEVDIANGDITITDKGDRVEVVDRLSRGISLTWYGTIYASFAPGARTATGERATRLVLIR